MAKKTWEEKLNSRAEPVVEVTEKAGMGMPPGTRLLISTPREIQSRVQAIPAGKSLSVAELRADLAKAHKADATCPLTTGIFLRIVAEVALEQMAAGSNPGEVAPFWRVVDPTSPLAKKLSCGPDRITALRSAEGI